MEKISLTKEEVEEASRLLSEDEMAILPTRLNQSRACPFPQHLSGICHFFFGKLEMPNSVARRTCSLSPPWGQSKK